MSTTTVAEVHKALVQPGMPFEMEERRIGGLMLRVWKNAPPHLRAVFENTKTHFAHEYAVYQDDRMGYEAHYRAVSRLAGLLQERYGVRKGDRVAIAMRNYPEWIVAFWAVAVSGAIVVPLNAWWTAQELEYGLKDSGARFLFADGERMERLRADLSALGLAGTLVARPAGALPKGADDLAALLGPVNDYKKLPMAEPPAVPLDPEDDATILYTSGTTGRPKGALGTHRNICTNIISSGFSAARDLLRRGLPLPDPTTLPKRTTLLSVPFFHVTGCHSVLVPLTFGGHRLVMMHRFDPSKALQLIEKERITQIGGVPTIAWQILEHPDFDKYDTSSIMGVAYGGAPSAPELVKRIKKTFPAALAGNGYGMTETSALTSQNSGLDYELRPESAGPPLPICDVRVVDEAGKEVPTGMIGELWIRGVNIVKGYWNNPEATSKSITEGWMHTGDLVRVDEEGFLYIVDRAKDMVIRGGENVYCVEVEAALFDHPAVMDAAVFGIPHKTLGEEVAAIVTLKPGTTASEAELKAHVGGKLASYKVPVIVEIRRQALPRNDNGKVVKRELKDVFIATHRPRGAG